MGAICFSETLDSARTTERCNPQAFSYCAKDADESEEATLPRGERLYKLQNDYVAFAMKDVKGIGRGLSLEKCRFYGFQKLFINIARVRCVSGSVLLYYYYYHPIA
jgi:hypothetical protein